MRKRRQTDEISLNLAPIMNMVVILIPLLLLSVVFLSVGVINVSAPSLVPGGTTGETTEDPRVTLAIVGAGFTLSSRDGELDQIPVDDEDEFNALMNELTNARSSGDRTAEEQVLDKLTHRYSWGKLYRTMLDARERYPDAKALHITADPDIPYAMIVKVMDAVRVELPSDGFESDAQFWAASKEANGAPHASRLFADPILNVAR